MVVCVSHGYPPGDVELFSSSGYQTLILHTSQYTTHFLNRYVNDSSSKINGDIFLLPNRNGLFYTRISLQSSEKKTERLFRFVVGYLGDKDDVESLDDFANIVASVLSNDKQYVEWKVNQPSNSSFLELIQNEGTKYVDASTISETEVTLSEKLEDPIMHEVALIVKRAGAMLEEDIVKKITKHNAHKAIEELVQANLLTLEYVVICRKTSNQINRMSSRDTLNKIANAGIYCSCGKAISEERIEELFSPTPMLQTMLDQSHWTTARLVYVLRQLGIQDDRILLNLHEGPEEIDAFVDMDGIF